MTTRSHLADGRCVVLPGGDGPTAGWVVDAELDRPPPAALARRYGADRFWERWTRAECAAKLDDEPIALRLRAHGLEEPDPRRYHLQTLRAEGGTLVVSVGTRAAVSGPEHR